MRLSFVQRNTVLKFWGFMFVASRIAAIKQTLEAYSEAVTEYQVILDRDPDYVPALKGIRQYESRGEK